MTFPSPQRSADPMNFPSRVGRDVFAGAVVFVTLWMVSLMFQLATLVRGDVLAAGLTR